MPCITQQTPVDPKEQRRQRDRERYAKMDKSKKDEINRKRREAYHRKKTAPDVRFQDAEATKSRPHSDLIRRDGKSLQERENVDHVGDNEWLRRNDTYQRRPIQTSFEERENHLNGISTPKVLYKI